MLSNVCLQFVESNSLCMDYKLLYPVYFSLGSGHSSHSCSLFQKPVLLMNIVCICWLPNRPILNFFFPHSVHLLHTSTLFQILCHLHLYYLIALCPSTSSTYNTLAFIAFHCFALFFLNPVDCWSMCCIVSTLLEIKLLLCDWLILSQIYLG